MNGEELGRRAPAFVGISDAESEERPATLEAALHDAAEQATSGGLAGKPMTIVHIELTPGNPHVTQYKVIVTPGP